MPEARILYFPSNKQFFFFRFQNLNCLSKKCDHKNLPEIRVIIHVSRLNNLLSTCWILSLVAKELIPTAWQYFNLYLSFPIPLYSFFLSFFFFLSFCLLFLWLYPFFPLQFLHYFPYFQSFLSFYSLSFFLSLFTFPSFLIVTLSFFFLSFDLAPLIFISSCFFLTSR